MSLTMEHSKLTNQSSYHNWFSFSSHSFLKSRAGNMCLKYDVRQTNDTQTMYNVNCTKYLFRKIRILQKFEVEKYMTLSLLK